MLITFPAALILTIITEGIVYYFYFRRKDSFAYAGIISGITLPLLWFFTQNYYFYGIELLGEAAVFAVETIMIRKLLKKDWQTSIEVSAVSNLASYLLGVLLYFI